jgi:hypothetical protein
MNITKNMRDRKGRRYTFMGTHDEKEKKLRTSLYRAKFKKRSEGKS